MRQRSKLPVTSWEAEYKAFPPGGGYYRQAIVSYDLERGEVFLSNMTLQNANVLSSSSRSVRPSIEVQTQVINAVHGIDFGEIMADYTEKDSPAVTYRTIDFTFRTPSGARRVRVSDSYVPPSLESLFSLAWNQNF